jgi:hypothetical protein
MEICHGKFRNEYAIKRLQKNLRLLEPGFFFFNFLFVGALPFYLYQALYYSVAACFWAHLDLSPVLHSG